MNTDIVTEADYIEILANGTEAEADGIYLDDELTSRGRKLTVKWLDRDGFLIVREHSTGNRLMVAASEVKAAGYRAR